MMVDPTSSPEIKEEIILLTIALLLGGNSKAQ